MSSRSLQHVEKGGGAQGANEQLQGEGWETSGRGHIGYTRTKTKASNADLETLGRRDFLAPTAVQNLIVLKCNELAVNEDV